MKIIINTSSMVPIYEQIMDAVKQMISRGELKEGAPLPSVRTLAKELKISALTVKKAYDNLETEGFTTTIHGKGTYVSASNTSLLKEHQRREIEKELERTLQRASDCGMERVELHELIDLIWEDL